MSEENYRRIENLLKKYENPTQFEETSPDYRNNQLQDVRVRQRHEILEDLLSEVPFHVNPAQKRNIKWIIDTFKDLEELHPNAKKEAIILSFIFLHARNVNRRIVMNKYSICKKYGLDFKTYTKVIENFVFKLMETRPL